jgi:hypothetical protein
MAVRSAMHQAGALALSQLLQFPAPAAERRNIPCSCGQQAGFRELRSKPVLTAVGEVTVARPYYLCPRCHHGQFPADVELDIENTEFSPGVRRMEAVVSQEAPFDHGRRQMKLLAGLDLTTKAVERTAEAIGEDIAAREREEMNRAMQLDLPMVVGKPIPILYVEVDGTGVPVVKKETAGRQGKAEGQPSHTREAKLGCVFTQTAWDREGYAIRDLDSTTYVGAIETAEEFGKRIYLEAWKRGWSRAEKKVVIGDGAEWIWNIAAQHFPGAIQIVDLFHARQHLWDLARKLCPNQEAEQRRWMKGRLKIWQPRSVRSIPPAQSWPKRSASKADTLQTMPTACATLNSAVSTCSLALALSKLAAKPSSVLVASSPACSGRSAEPTPFWPCDVVTSTTASRLIGRTAALD